MKLIKRDEYKVIMSRMNNPVISYGGHRYYRERHPMYPHKYWTCTISKCKSRANLLDNGDVIIKRSHSHGPKYDD